MLLGGSMSVRFLLGLIIASITNEIHFQGASAAETSKLGGAKFVRPDYSEYYNTKVAAAIKDYNDHPGSAASASENIYKHIERDPLGIEKYINRGFDGEEKAHETKSDFSYTPYEVPVKELAKHKRENEYEAAIDALDKEYSIPTTYKLKDDIKLEGSGESVKPASSNDASFASKSPEYSLDESSFGGGGGGSGGGNQAGGFQYKIPHYYTRHTETPVNDKYVKSSSHNYDYEPEEIQRASLKSSNCKKIVKEGASKDTPMTCHVCKDPKTGAKSEQCSYTSAPEPKSFYSSKNEKYSQPHKAENIRFRRYAPKKQKDDFVDPYEYVKAESQKYFSKPKEFESEYYKPKDYYEEYKFPEDYFAGDSSIKSESEIQSENLMKQGGVCKEVVKNNMKCKVCKNEKTGGNYEQCSYTSEPSEKKYAYVSERKFDGDGNPIEDKVEESSEPKATKVVKPQEKSSFERKLSEVKSEEKKPASRGSRRAKFIDDNPYDVPKHFVEDTQNNEKLRIPGLNPELYGSADSSFDSQKEKYIAPDEYQDKLFSKLNRESEQQGSNDANQNLQEFQTEDNKKDVEKVLEEFSKKDRSSCKKAHKNGMTCYLCVNKEGTQHEECMYVAANSPQVSHVAYHEVEEFKNKGKPEAAASTLKETEVNAPVKRKRFFKKVTSIPSNIQAAPSDIKPTKTKYVPSASSGASFKTPRKLRRSRNFSGTDPVFAESKIQETKVKRPNYEEPHFAESKIQETKVKRPHYEEPHFAESKNQETKEVKRSDYKEPHLPTPQEFVVGEAEGAFSSETKPVYSKAFGVTLPRYMLEKSEFEKNFDEFSSS